MATLEAAVAALVGYLPLDHRDLTPKHHDGLRYAMEAINGVLDGHDPETPEYDDAERAHAVIGRWMESSGLTAEAERILASDRSGDPVLRAIDQLIAEGRGEGSREEPGP